MAVASYDTTELRPAAAPGRVLLARVLLDPELAARLRTGAAELARTRLGWAAFRQALSRIYENAIATDGNGEGAARTGS